MPGQFQMTNTLRVLQMFFFGLVFFAGSVVVAQNSAPGATPAQQTAPAPMPVSQAPANQGQEASEPQTLHLLVGRSLVITSPARIKRVSLADPEIAEAIVVSPTQVLVNGRKPGGVS